MSISVLSQMLQILCQRAVQNLHSPTKLMNKRKLIKIFFFRFVFYLLCTFLIDEFYAFSLAKIPAITLVDRIIPMLKHTKAL